VSKLLFFFLSLFVSSSFICAMDSSSQDQLNVNLFSAIKAGNAELVKNLIAKGADVHAQARMSNGGCIAESHTVLTWAVKNGREALCTLLLEAKADVAARTRFLDHTHPLNMRSKYKCTDPCLFEGFNALDCAACFGNVALCLLFIKAGADLNAQGFKGATALMWAAQYGRDQVCKLFLEQGAALHLKNDMGGTALVVGACYGNRNEKACRVLIESGVWPGNIQDQLTEALSAGAQHTEIAKLLVTKRANVNARDCRGNTPLMVAVNNGNEALCSFLIDHGADVNVKDADGRAVIRWAIEHSNVQICRLLLSRNADVNTRDAVGDSPLMHAAGHKFDAFGIRSYPLCDLLIKAGANVHAKNNSGWNALMWAARKECRHICTLLVEKHSQDDQSKKALWLSMKRLKAQRNAAAHVLYRNFKTLLLSHFQPSLSSALTARYSDGKIPYDYCKIDCLNPALLNRPAVPVVSEVSIVQSGLAQDDLALPSEPAADSSSWCSVQ